MPFYTDTQIFYTTLRETFNRIERDSPHAVSGLLNSRLLVRLKFTHPLAEITVNGRRPALQVIYGPSKIMPDFDARLTGDTVHQIFLGQVTLAHALNTGRLTVIGPIWKAAPLADLFAAAKLYYPTVLKDRGLL